MYSKSVVSESDSEDWEILIYKGIGYICSGGTSFIAVVFVLVLSITKKATHISAAPFLYNFLIVIIIDPINYICSGVYSLYL
jgi:hypothetical protein